MYFQVCIFLGVLFDIVNISTIEWVIQSNYVRKIIERFDWHLHYSVKPAITCHFLQDKTFYYFRCTKISNKGLEHKSEERF